MLSSNNNLKQAMAIIEVSERDLFVSSAEVKNAIITLASLSEKSYSNYLNQLYKTLLVNSRLVLFFEALIALKQPVHTLKNYFPENFFDILMQKNINEPSILPKETLKKLISETYLTSHDKERLFAKSFLGTWLDNRTYTRDEKKIILSEAIDKKNIIINNRVTAQNIPTRNSEERPSVENWIRIYNKEMGIANHDQVMRGKFIYKSTYTKNLSQHDIFRLSVILRLYDDNIPVAVDTNSNVLILPKKSQKKTPKKQLAQTTTEFNNQKVSKKQIENVLHTKKISTKSDIGAKNQISHNDTSQKQRIEKVSDRRFGQNSAQKNPTNLPHTSQLGSTKRDLHVTNDIDIPKNIKNVTFSSGQKSPIEKNQVKQRSPYKIKPIPRS